MRLPLPFLPILTLALATHLPTPQASVSHQIESADASAIVMHVESSPFETGASAPMTTVSSLERPRGQAIGGLMVAVIGVVSLLFVIWWSFGLLGLGAYWRDISILSDYTKHEEQEQWEPDAIDNEAR
ncbi:hypothetical protein M501DRAFT_990125 [Patellaria atrata CBS 101060]|uniref:Transmembrane protein n=1 Tax=Patellaria atrata CBS 101060 TaxID=1346257 RepID=A0A9P4VU56_9PEZI|nr:hypothetical protein M501DRAFT_990125 [Patellaria atrata CBS 101060]